MSACSGKIYIAAPDTTDVNKCLNVSCQPGTFCSNGQCLSIVLNGFPCNPLNLKGDCPAGEVCASGTCYPASSQPQACAVGVNGQCADPNLSCNTGNGQCGPIVNSCDPNSAPSGQCRNAQRCVDGYCFFDTGLDCTADQVNGLCPNDEQCSSVGSCTAITGSVCNPNHFQGACPAWQACAQGQCVGPLPPKALACSPNNVTGLCPANELCVNGGCVDITADNVCNGSHLSGLCAAGAGCLSPGYCEVLTPANTCSPSHLTGGCGYGGSCEKGACVQTPCGQPGGYSCAAGSRCDVPSGQCVPVVCDPLHPQGACVQPSSDPNAQLACDSGRCVPPTCAAALDPVNEGVCTYGLVCRAGGVCTPPDCGTTAIDSSIPSTYCPSSHDVCTNGACVRKECSPTVLDGVCSLTPTASVKDPYRGTVQVPAVCCDANLVNATGCVLGQCAAPLCANSPNVIQGQCLNSGSDYCSNGNCIPAPCTPIYPQGQCTTPEVCSAQAGTCTLPDCVHQSDPNGYCAPKLCDQDNSAAHTGPGGTYNTCVSPACAANPNVGSCSAGQACCNPNLVSTGDPNCTGPSEYGQCITPACSFNYPGGSCGPGLLCTPTRSCDPNSPGNNCCARPPCSDDYPSGNCGANFACALNSATSHYTCQIEMCSPLAPKGTCNTAGYRCYNGNISDPNYGTCQPFACSDYYPTAPCPTASGTQCILSGGHYSCQVPPCGLMAPAQPGGVCSNSNQICVAGVCITPACSTTYLAGACPSSQQCCDTALNAARSCEKGTCAPKACDGNYLNGYCPAGQICCNASLSGSSGFAGCASNKGTCQTETCSPSFPAAPCPTAGDICVSGSCQTPCSSTARKGWCPPSFACVNGACSTACTNDFDCDNISNSLECPGNPNTPSLCTTDTDGDGSPDSVDRDADNDGIPDVVERGCVASTSCTISTTPTATTSGTYDFRNLDSDGDRIGDGVEAGPVASLPQDTDKDGLPNYRDTDSDGDGILDRCEATDAYGVCNSGNTLILAGSGLVDTNGNGKPDYMDLDSDSDGVSDTLEATDKTGTFRPNGVYTRGAGSGYPPDYRNLDSDGDGAPDQQEDVNGNGIVDCQLDGNGNFVIDPRPSPACASASSGMGLYYNPGCNCTTAGNPNGCVTPGKKCVFAETSRVEVDTNLNSIRDPNDAVFQVCGANNLKKINLFYSQSNDYAFALERSYQTTANVRAGNGNVIGIAFDDTNADSPAGSVNGSYAVSGMLFAKPPSGTAMGQTTALQKALAQAQGDGTAIGGASGVSSSALVINRNFMSFDGFGTVVSRYHVITGSAVTAYALRNNIAKAMDSNDLGSVSLPTCTNTVTATDFTVNMETLYRYDDGNTGRVIVILAVTPTGADQTAVDSYNYRPSCTGLPSSTCLGEHGCTYTTGSCTARQNYQIPLFFADNITNGSAITQYGSDIAAFCQSLVQQSSVLDFMWVVDNSISMAPKIGQVSKASDLFFGLLNNTEADYRVGLTTTAPSMDNQPTVGPTVWEPIYPGCFAQTSKADCETDAQKGGCSWDSTASQCKPLCTPYTTSSACQTAGCTWNNPNSSCYFAGCASVTDSTACGNVGCFWNSTLSKCTHTARADRANGSVVADFTGAVYGRYDLAPADRSVAYACQEGCATEDQTNGTLPTGLYDRCASLTSQGSSVCGAYPQCYWSGSACVANCCPLCNGIGGTAPASSTAFNNAACYFASRLPGDDGNGFEYGLLMGEWAMYRAGAHAGCANAQDANSCGVLSGCVWYGTGSQCIAATCSFTSTLPNSYSAEDQCNGNFPNSAASSSSQATILQELNTPQGNYTQQNMPEPPGCEYSRATNTCLPSIGVPCGAYFGASGDFPYANCPAPRCTTSGGICVPNPAYSDVQCDATNATSCYLQGPNWCAWDTCSGHASASECASVYGCYWNSGSCQAVSNGGTCHPPLTRQIRANATRVAVLLSDEEECYVKDGSSGSVGAAYDGRCEFVNYGGGLMSYGDQLRTIRTNSYLQAYAARNFLTFAIVGDKADASSTNTAVANWSTGAGCPSGCTYYSGDPSNPTATNSGIAKLQAMCVVSGTLPPQTPVICPKTNGGCMTQIPNGPLVEAEAGQAYINVAEGTGGGWGSICASNLYPSIESTVIASVAKASPYHLNGFVNGHAVQPISATIQVGVQVCKTGVYPYCNADPNNITTQDPNNTQVIVPLARSRTNGFDYDPSNNSIVLYGSARAFTSGDIVVSYRYWVNSSQPVAGADPSCPCPGTSLGNNCACDPGKSCGVSGPNPLPPGINLCNTTANNANETVCNKVAGCVWNSALSNGVAVGCEPTGVCEYDPTCGGRCTTGQVCDKSSGLCVCDLGCGNGCSAGAKCDTGGSATCTSITDPTICNGSNNGKCAWNYDQGKCDSATCGQCVCDTGCGGGCAAGQKCDTATSSPTCGQCACDTTCGGGCPAHQACDSNPASGTCGFCKAPVCTYQDSNNITQAGCPSGQLCDASNGNCVCDTSCGGSCRQGTTCDPNTNSATCGQCLCDTNCDNVTCAAGQKCDSNPADKNTCGLCVVDPTCGNVNCNPTCAYGTVSACAADSNCLWKSYKGSGGACGPKNCSVCNPVAGLCSADSTCCGGCGPQQTCDASSGSCVCDTTCGGQACQIGYACDSDPTHATCGSCVCDTTCGGPCPLGDKCNSDTTSSNCGLCLVDPTCGGGCPYPYQCDASTGLCKPSPCGVCPTGYHCSSLTLQCVSNSGG